MCGRAALCSGGQRKRVNIGLELVSRPSLLFMVRLRLPVDGCCEHDVLGVLPDQSCKAEDDPARQAK
jgi:ABC-type glutathione transport system ATPase component